MPLARLAAALLALAATPDAGVAPPPGCRDDPRARALDFWAGEWEVLTPAGHLAGHSRVEPILDGCVLLEHWEGARGGRGKSFNLFDRTTGQWRQTWVDSQGTQVDFTGGLEGRSMVYRSQGPGPGGKPQRTRMTFTPLPGGEVRQLWEASADEGRTWTVNFDGRYRPRGAAGQGAPRP